MPKICRYVHICRIRSGMYWGIFYVTDLYILIYSWYIYCQEWSIVVCIRSYLPVYPPNRMDMAGTDAHTRQAITGARATSLQLKRQGLLTKHWMVWWKDHCPRIDMEDQAASARLIRLVTLSILEACLLPCMHTVRDCSCLASWNQGQATQDAGQATQGQIRARLTYGFWAKNTCQIRAIFSIRTKTYHNTCQNVT